MKDEQIDQLEIIRVLKRSKSHKTFLVRSQASVDEAQAWFREFAEGRENFWVGVHDRYKRRDVPREKVVAFIDIGLRIRAAATNRSVFQVKEHEYGRFMDFWRRSKCRLDFRPYRKLPLIS